MTPAQRTRSLVAALALLSVAGAILAYYAIALGRSPALGALLAVFPLVLVAAVAVHRSKRRAPLLLALAAALALLWSGWDTIERHVPDLYFVEHVGTNLLLGAMFGRTLFGNRKPLCTHFAQLLHGPLPPAVERYTRQVTLAWTLFFVVLAALSCVLYFGGYLAAWSVLATLLTLPLVLGMFVVEYAVRLRALPGWQRVGILSGARAFWMHSRAAPSEAPR